MQRITFINSIGQKAVFNETAPYVFWQISGLEYPGVIPNGTQAAGQHGYTLHDILLDERFIKLSAHIHGKSGVAEMYKLRNQLSGILNPLLGLGTLIYENDILSRQIKAFVSGNPNTWKLRNFTTLDISFECPNPFFKDIQPFEAHLSYVSGGLEFPLETPAEFGLLGYLAHVYNDSDNELPFELFMDGGSVNPVILNKTTGEFIKLSKNIQYGESLYINTDPEHMEVSLVSVDPETNQQIKTNAYGYLTTDSNLRVLRRGLNDITFLSDDQSRNVKIRIRYYKQWLGC